MPLAGVTISSVSLHNEEQIVEKDIRVNDTVLVERAGDVIPYIVGPVKELRTGNERPFSFISECPSCFEALVKTEGEAAWRCINVACPAQAEERIIHFVSKGAMDIDGLGKDIVRRFMRDGIIDEYTGIYLIDYDSVLELEGWKERSVENLKTGIEKSKENPLWRLIVGLGIRHIGSTSAKMLAKQVSHLLDFQDWTEEQLTALEDVGPKVAASLLEFFSNAKNIEMIQALESAGVNLRNALDAGAGSQVLADKSFLFTGKLTQFTRDEAKEMVEENGGKIMSGVSAKLNFLVVGENAGSKLAKAQSLGTVGILTEQEFLAMLPT